MEKLAEVLAALAGVKVTVPGPLVFDQETVSVGGEGNPSSLAEPLMIAGPGKVTVKSVPALTVGAVFAGETTTVAVSELARTPSLAVSCST